MTDDMREPRLEPCPLDMRLRYEAQNNHMVDQYFTDLGKLLTEAANRIIELEARQNPDHQPTIYDGRMTVERRRLEPTREEVEKLIEAAYRQGAHDGLKHGPIVTKWCFTPARARAALSAMGPKLEIVARMRWENNTWRLIWASSNLDGSDGNTLEGKEFDFVADATKPQSRKGPPDANPMDRPSTGGDVGELVKELKDEARINHTVQHDYMLGRDRTGQLLERAAATLASQRERIERFESLSAQMADDEGLWFVAQTAPEAYLQQQLRRLCAAIEEK